MASREAACSCGQLRVVAEGDPVRISMCHCLACQRRTGSAFGIQARFPAERVQVTGTFSEYVRVSDDEGEERAFRFCPGCGGTVFYTTTDRLDLIAVPVGAFADPSFPAPTVSVYGQRRHTWLVLPHGVEQDEAWTELAPLFEAGEYAEVADRGQALIAADPENVRLLYNVACAESLAGRTGDAIEHLRHAIGLEPEPLRGLAAGDSDFDPIRAEPAFRDLVG
jgi:hypothetical protein